MDTTAPHHDVIVVGARAAGAATAMLLARAGMRVLVVDRAQYGTDTLSTHALMRGGVMQLNRWGLLDAVVAAGTPPIRKTTFTYGSDQVVITIKPSFGVDALYAPRRTVLDTIIVDAAREAGADVRYGIAVRDVTRDDHGRVTGIVGRDRDGRRFIASAPLVIGADGMRSTIADRVGAPTERTATATSAVVYGYWGGLATDGYEWIFEPEAAAGVIPTNGGEACVFAASTPDRVGRGGPTVMLDLLVAASPDLAARVAAGTAPTAVRTFTGQHGYVRRPWGPGWALVGDAGYWKDPLSVHGLTDALRDAELLARAVVDSEHEGDAAFAAYHDQRNALSWRLFDTVETIAAQKWSREEIGGLLLQLSSAMADEVEALAALDAGVRS
jgi:2-polyprenyl-6-methoxyphenol hydroxylase-like FAD-dependent oxidoreductase